jgi:hypothetical protein
MEWHQLSFPEDVDPMDLPNALISEAEAIYQKMGSPKEFCVFQEINHESSCAIALFISAPWRRVIVERTGSLQPIGEFIHAKNPNAQANLLSLLWVMMIHVNVCCEAVICDLQNSSHPRRACNSRHVALSTVAPCQRIV